jgi:hypothetical protein
MKTIADVLTSVSTELSHIENDLRSQSTDHSLADAIARARARIAEAVLHPGAAAEMNPMDLQAEVAENPFILGGSDAAQKG